MTQAAPERMSTLRRLALGRSAASLALGCALIAGLKLWLVADDEVLARAIPHDHQRYAEMAFEILHGRWLGDYDHMTLIREPVYPVWVAGVHATGVPLRLAAELLLAAAAALFVAVLRGAGVPTALALGCFGLLVLQPHSFLVNRELLAAGFYLPVLLIAISGLLLAAGAASLRRRVLHAAWTGLALGALWTTRPEKPLVLVVIAAFALLDLARRRAGGATWRRAAGPVGVPVMGAVLGIAAFTTGFSALNHRHYGMFVTSELSAPGFVAANAALLGIEHEAPRRFVLVPHEVRERAYAASPAFRELRPGLEAPSAGRSVSCSLVNVCDDFAGAWFMWTMREAAARAGHMDSAPAADLFFQKIADEIARARARGELPRERANLPPLHPRPETYLAHLAGSFRRIAWRVAMPGEWSDWDPLGDDVSTPEALTQLFDEVANRRPWLAESHSATVEGWAVIARDPVKGVVLRRARVGGGAAADVPGPPVEIGSVRVRGEARGQLGFRFDVENSAGAFHSMEPTVAFSRASGATTELPLPQAGASAERDGIRVVVEAVTERDGDGPLRRGIRRALWRAHALGIRVLTLLGVVSAVLLVLPPWRGRRPDRVSVALGLILVVVVSRVAMLTALDAGSFPAWSSRYVYPVASLTGCGLLLLVFEALRHRTRRAVAE